MAIHHFKVAVDDRDQRLDIYLTEHFSKAPSRSFIKKLIDHGHVRVNEVIAKAHHKVAPGEDVIVEVPEDFLTPQYIQPENIPLDIFYEDQHLLVINKPSGMLVHPAQNIYKGTLVNALLHYANHLSDVNDSMRPGIVHRLDQETSGLILVAKDNITHTRLAKQFKRHEVRKQYVALVEGEVEFDEGTVDVPIGRDTKHREKKTVAFDKSAKEAFTRYKVLQRHNDVTLVALFPKTGRTHQLRVHMRYIKHPILGDSKYGKKNSFSRLALHAKSIGFKHPMTKEYVEFSSKVPDEFLTKVYGKENR